MNGYDRTCAARPTEWRRSVQWMNKTARARFLFTFDFDPFVLLFGAEGSWELLYCWSVEEREHIDNLSAFIIAFVSATHIYRVAIQRSRALWLELLFCRDLITSRARASDQLISFSESSRARESSIVKENKKPQNWIFIWITGKILKYCLLQPALSDISNWKLWISSQFR